MTTQRIVLQRHDLRGILLLAAAFTFIPAACLAVPFLSPLLTSDQWAVLLPVLAATAILIGFIVALRTYGPVSFLEIGVVYAGCVYAYGTYTMIRYMLNGFTLPDWTDSRMFVFNPAPGELGRLTWLYTLYLVSFCVVYYAARPARETPRAEVRDEPDKTMFIITALFLVVVRTGVAVVTSLYHLHAETYIEEYAAIQHLPRLPRQLFSWLLGSEQTLQIMFMLALLCHYRRRRWPLLTILGLWTLLNLFRPGARTALFFLLLAVAVGFERIVRCIRLRTLLVAVCVGFVVYLAMGIKRAQREEGEGKIEITHSYSEFEGIFANAVDIAYGAQAEGAFRGQPKLYFGDVIATIPQQFVPFQKSSAAEWYAQTYYTAYYAAGGGLAFGIVSEALVGYGWPELIWRGALIGIVFALIHRRVMRGSVSFWMLTLYVWSTVWCYQTVRNTTFGLLMLFVQRMFVPFVAVKALSMLLHVHRRLPLLRSA